MPEPDLSESRNASGSSDTIYACATAPGKAALAIVRVSGPQALAIAAALAPPMPKARYAALRTLRDPETQRTIDEAVVIAFHAPASATGEDLVEFQIHGGRAVLAALYESLGRFPKTRLAEAGEFARRAFDNGKIDLTTAEGIADLIDAETESQHKQAQLHASGHLGALYEDWRRRIIEAQALVEAAIDFSDESDVAETAIAQGFSVIEPLVRAITAHLADARRGEIIRGGFRVAIAGPPNAGKSSLLNTLAQRDAAIVSNQPGTTRDVVQVQMDLQGMAIIVSDTAGIRTTSSEIEQEGIRRAWDQMQTADLVIWLDSRDAPSPPPPDLENAFDPRTQTQTTKNLHSTAPSVIRVTNKCDLMDPIILDDAELNRTNANSKTGFKNNAPIYISVKTNHGIDALIEEITASARTRLAATSGNADLIPSRVRHAVALRDAISHLSAFCELYKTQQTLVAELAAEELRFAARAIGRLTGRIDVEDVLDQIFSRFCIGK